MPLSECMQSHTHRQFLVWMDWLDQQWNRPDIVCQYLMQIACEVRRGYVKKPAGVKIDHFRLKFENTAKSPPLSKERVTQLAKARWVGMMTMPVQHVTRE